MKVRNKNAETPPHVAADTVLNFINRRTIIMKVARTHSADPRAYTRADARPHDADGPAGRPADTYPRSSNNDCAPLPQEEQLSQTIDWLKDCIAGLKTVGDHKNTHP